LAQYSPPDYALNADEDVFEHDAYIQAVTDRQAEAFAVKDFKPDHITGTIETFGERMLFFSIPAARGWDLYINGARTPIQTVNIGFIGAQVGPGVNDIELKYHIPGSRIGAGLSIVSFSVFIGMVFFRKRLVF
jgi:uncharacterized membrane protein YfhO